MKKKILLKSPLLTVSGYGTHARTVLRALRKYEDYYFDIYLDLLNWGRCGWIWEDDEERRYIDSLMQKTLHYINDSKGNPQYDIFCHVTIPNEWEQRAPINIGITAGIETTKIAAIWVEKTQLVDKIIVVSEHAKYGFDKTCYEAQNSTTGEIIKDFKCIKPVHVIGYPIRNVSIEKREKLTFDFETNFNYLLIAQWSARKNVEKTILWFVEENLDREDVGLICKLNTSANCIMDKDLTEKRLLGLLANKFPNRKCKLYFIHGDMNEAEMASLYTHPKIKAAISISPEGYGLFAFESAFYGLPVVTYGWGGPCDFMFMPQKNKKNKIYEKPMFAEVEYELKPIPSESIWDGVLIKESQWAYPKEGSFKIAIRDMHINYPKYKEMAQILQRYLEDKFSEEKIYQQYAEVIYGEKIKNINKEIPKVSIITSVFKAAEYLKGCFEDIERQTLFINSVDKCEHIIVHPKSSPQYKEEKELILNYCNKHPTMVKYIELDEDPGLYGCWNVGIKNSNGTFITNWNTDDRRAPNCIEKCAKELYINENIGFIYFDQWITDKPNETFDINSSNGKRYNFPNYDFSFLKMMNLNHAMGMWKKELHDKYGYFDPKYKSAGDWHWTLLCCSKGVKMGKLNDILGLYYFNPYGISTNPENFSWKRKEEEEIYNTFKDIEL